MNAVTGRVAIKPDAAGANCSDKVEKYAENFGRRPEALPAASRTVN